MGKQLTRLIMRIAIRNAVNRHQHFIAAWKARSFAARCRIDYKKCPYTGKLKPRSRVRGSRKGF